MKPVIISLGGSIVAPDGLDSDFLQHFRATIEHLLAEQPRQFVVVCGGGAPARRYQQVYRELAETPLATELDWIGVAATRLNARLVQALFGKHCRNDLVTDPSSVEAIDGELLIAAGWKPGFSTDYVAVQLATRFGSDRVINLSNVQQVYSSDPRHDPQARPLGRIGWGRFLPLAGESWSPGSNVPFDPVASRLAAEQRLQVIVASRDCANLVRIIHGEAFVGTVIGPEL